MGLITTAEFPDFYNSTMLPAFRAFIADRVASRKRPLEYTQLFDVMSSTRSIEQFSDMSELGLFAEVGEGEPARYDKVIQGFKKTLSHSRFTLGVKTTADMVEDDQYNIVNRQMKYMADSAKETMEVYGARILNNAFVTTGADGRSYTLPNGKALCATDHPLIKSGGLFANRAAVAQDLDQTSLEQAYTDVETSRNSAGHLIRVRAVRVVVPPKLRFAAARIVKSEMQSDTANNTRNALQDTEDGRPSVFVYHYLTDPDAWFLTAPPGETGMIWFWRRKPYTKGEFDFDTESAKTVTRYRMSCAAISPYGVWGSPGA